MDERMARLESDVHHIQSDVSELKQDMRRLDAKIDAKYDALDAKIDSKFDALDAKFDRLDEKVNTLALSTEKGFAGLTRWGIGLYVMLVAGLATGFMWLIQRLPPIH